MHKHSLKKIIYIIKFKWRLSKKVNVVRMQKNCKENHNSTVQQRKTVD